MKENKVYYLLISDQNVPKKTNYLTMWQAVLLVLAVTKMFTQKLRDKFPCGGEKELT